METPLWQAILKIVTWPFKEKLEAECFERDEYEEEDEDEDENEHKSEV